MNKNAKTVQEELELRRENKNKQNIHEWIREQSGQPSDIHEWIKTQNQAEQKGEKTNE